MIKNFETYKNLQSFADDYSQWENTETGAKVCIDDNCTRQLVRDAFKAQEDGINVAVFTKETLSNY